MRADILSLALASLLSTANGLPLDRRSDGSVTQPKVTITDSGVVEPTTASEVLLYRRGGKIVRTATEVVAVVPRTPTPISGSGPNALDEAAEAKDKPDSHAVLISRAGPNHGITYSPYKKNNQCKSAAEVKRDFQVFKGKYSVVRLYGVDCDQVKSGVAAAKSIGVKLFLGIFETANIPAQVNTLKNGVGGDWGIVDTVSFGNEMVNNGRPLNTVLNGLRETRGLLRKAGFKGPVVTCDTFVAVGKHPALCDESDYCAMNMHPFFDPNTRAEDAGKFIKTQMDNIRKKLKDKNKRIVVTETGWPHGGNAHGRAAPSKQNQNKAIAGIKGVFSKNKGDLILFSGFDDEWKKDNQFTHGAEKFWGIHGKAPAQ